LDAVLLRLKRDEEARHRATRRMLAAGAVGLLHVAIILALLRADWLPLSRPIRSEEPKLLWLLLPHAPGTQEVQHKKSERDLEHSAPVTIVLPITPPRPQPQPTESINPATALGQALACGASSYEYLSPAARDKCKHMPWHYKFDKFGNIVLDTQERPPEQAQRETGAEAQERIMNTADPCLAAKVTGTPCMDQIINGGGRH
jgi:hypothetical protein